MCACCCWCTPSSCHPFTQLLHVIHLVAAVCASICQSVGMAYCAGDDLQSDSTSDDDDVPSDPDMLPGSMQAAQHMHNAYSRPLGEPGPSAVRRARFVTLVYYSATLNTALWRVRCTSPNVAAYSFVLVHLGPTQPSVCRHQQAL